MKRGELNSRLLILVTLALVAFGLVMVYSATSAAAAVGGKDPSYYLKRQGIYAALGIVLMMVAQRWDYRRLTARVAGSRSARPSSSRRSWRSCRLPSGPRRTSRVARRRATCASSGVRSAR